MGLHPFGIPYYTQAHTTKEPKNKKRLGERNPGTGINTRSTNKDTPKTTHMKIGIYRIPHQTSNPKTIA